MPHRYLSIAVLSLAITAPAHAELIEYSFSGELFSVGEGLWDEWAHVEVGDIYTASFVIDSNEPDQASSSRFGFYDLQWSTIEIGGVSETVAGNGILSVENWVTDSLDFYSGLGTDELSFHSEMHGLDPIDSDAIPTAISLPDYSVRVFEFWAGAIMRGSTDTVTIHAVPNLPTGLVFLLVSTRLRRRSRINP